MTAGDPQVASATERLVREQFDLLAPDPVVTHSLQRAAWRPHTASGRATVGLLPTQLRPCDAYYLATN